MAYTSVIPVRRLDRTVDYVQNKAKTTPKSLEEAVDYAANRDKTESACFETGLGCTTTSAFEDMRLNTLRWHKETGVQGYHLVQSFAEGEVTPELAHQIGVEFAEQLLHGKYQAIVTTHLNTKHYHNHIVWSAVSLEDGKKYHSNSKSYYTEVRALSDSLCQKYGLSIIETPEALRGKRQYEKWRAEENNQPTWRTAIRQDVDEAIQQSLTWRQFLSAMERKGYEVRMGRKYPVLRPPGKERFVRFKTLGKRYTPEAIQTRILYPQNYRPYVEKAPSVQHGRLHSGKKPHRKLTGLRALYYPNMVTKDVRKHLARCGISSKHAMQAIGTLSGGEQAKVKMCLLTLTPCNFLIMDEPTNHLDVQAKEALKTALSTFAGTVLLVSHEEAFYRGWTQRIINIEKK